MRNTVEIPVECPSKDFGYVLDRTIFDVRDECPSSRFIGYTSQSSAINHITSRATLIFEMSETDLTKWQLRHA